MKLTVNENGLQIDAETKQDIAFIRDTLGMEGANKAYEKRDLLVTLNKEIGTAAITGFSIYRQEKRRELLEEGKEKVG